jgi:hypothetical protein
MNSDDGQIGKWLEDDSKSTSTANAPQFQAILPSAALLTILCSHRLNGITLMGGADGMPF